MTSFAMFRLNDPRTHVQRQDSDTATTKKRHIVKYESKDAMNIYFMAENNLYLGLC